MRYIVGNWKMHGTPAMARALAAAVKAHAAPVGAEVVLCPPAPLLVEVAAALAGSSVKLGAQDCHPEKEGAFTGDISAPMLKAVGCAYVIVGHSERRQGHGETDDTVRRKAAAAIESGLIPIICIGETQPERESGRAEAIVGRQVKESIPMAKGAFLLAYEPVWAIGSGKTPTGADIGRMHAHIKTVAAQQTGLAPERISVLYGGSVKVANAKEILATPGVDGALVGGASLKAEEFCSIVG